MDHEVAKRQIHEALTRNGGKLPDAPDGPLLPAFDPTELARALVHEIERSKTYGWQRISIHMSFEDAAMLAAFLRRR